MAAQTPDDTPTHASQHTPNDTKPQHTHTCTSSSTLLLPYATSCRSSLVSASAPSRCGGRAGGNRETGQMLKTLLKTLAAP